MAERLRAVLREHRAAVIATLARSGAHNPRLFGSVARGDDGVDSDIDILVDLDDTVGLIALARMTRELAEILGVNVDVVPADGVKSAVRDDVLAEAVAL